MNTMQLACFTEVASTLSFSKAAGNLHVSQPTVSHQIRALEDELGVTLLARSTRSVSLTDEGMTFLGDAADMLTIARHAQVRLKSAREQGAGRLRIGVGSTLEAQLLVGPLRALVDELGHEGPTPTLRFGPKQALVDGLEGATLDAVLEFRDPEGAPAGATAFIRVAELPVAIVHAAKKEGKPAGDGTSIAASKLEELGLPMAACSPQVSPAAIVQLHREAANRMGPERIIMCPNAEAAFVLARANAAFTLYADTRELHHPGLSFTRIEDFSPLVLGVRLRRGRRPGLVEHFVEELRRSLGVS